MKYINDKKISSYSSLAIQNTCVSQPTNVIIVDEINNKKYKAIFKPENYTIKIDKDIHRCPNKDKDVLWEDNNGNLFKSTIIDLYLIVMLYFHLKS